MATANDMYKFFRENIRDDKQMLEVYRVIRNARDKVIQKTKDDIYSIVVAFENMSLQDQLELLSQLYELLFGKGEVNDKV